MRVSWIAVSILAACGGGGSDEPPVELPDPDATPVTVAFDEGTAHDVALPGPGALSIGDTDGDGDTDIVFGFATKVSVLEGDGTGGFAAQAPIDLGHNDVKDVVLRDETMSLAVRREFDSVVLDYPDEVYTDTRSIHAMAAGETWLAVHHLDAIALIGGDEVALPDVETFAGLAVADLDGDGLLDLATGGPRGELYTLRQSSPGVFDAPVATPALNPITTFVFAGQFGGDPSAELAALGNGRLRVYLDGAPVDTFVDLRGPIAVADINADGFDDLAAFTDSAVVLLADPNNPGTFVTAATLPTNGTDIAIADIDGDTLPDIIIASPTAVHVYRQQ